MEDTFAAILSRQEREDAAAAHSEAALRQAVCREFVNGKALLAAADFCMTDFFAAERTALPAVPIRTAAKFGIKKHTASQRPYRHGHDFYELICVHGGCCRQHVGDAPLLLAQGQCCLLPPGAEHEMERCGRGDVILKLVIPPPLFAAADGKALLSAGSPCGAGARMFGNMPAEADYFLFLLLRECGKENAPKELWIQSCLTLLFAALAGGAGTGFGTGGMVTKLAAAKIAMEQGFDMVITNGENPENLYFLAKGGHIGTLFCGKRAR